MKQKSAWILVLAVTVCGLCLLAFQAGYAAGRGSMPRIVCGDTLGAVTFTFDRETDPNDVKAFIKEYFTVTP